MSTLQIIGQRTKDMLVTRLKRDELTKKMYELRIELYKTNTSIELEYLNMSDLKIRMYSFMVKLYDLYKKNRNNNIIIESEHRKVTEMKMKTVGEIIALDKKNLINFDMAHEVKIGSLTDVMNYDYPANWDENKDCLSGERARLEVQIKELETLIAGFEPEGQEHVLKINQLVAKQSSLNAQIESLTTEILGLNDLIADDMERHPITLVNISQTDFSNINMMPE